MHAITVGKVPMLSHYGLPPRNKPKRPYAGLQRASDARAALPAADDLAVGAVTRRRRTSFWISAVAGFAVVLGCGVSPAQETTFRRRHCERSPRSRRRLIALRYRRSSDWLKSLKSIVHFYNTRDLLARCHPDDPGEGISCWPPPESTDNINAKRMGRLGLSDEEENALITFMQTLTDGFMQRGQQ